MNVLIIGAGGREHALAWKVAQSDQVDTVYVAPGNAGIALEPKAQLIPIAADAVAELLEFARAESIDLTIVGPEAPLVLGLVDAFENAGLACFGPTQAAAQLEGSKAFCKDFLRRHQIPTADYATFTQLSPALDYVHERGAPIVIKADGLAAGKGVVVASTQVQAEAAVRAMLAESAFGAAGSKIVIEEFLAGEELSFIALVDGKNILPLATSQDHKTRDDGDKGPNTGGMGAYSPATVATPTLQQRILTEIIEPTVRGMAADGHPYYGFLYAGLMIAADGSAKVIEYNCRCGDPETQPIMLRLRSDVVALFQAALAGKLDKMQADWDPRAALGVVMAAGGYPEAYRKGDVITGLAGIEESDSKVFHAGTQQQANDIVTAGGRVLCATALGTTVAEAQRQAYALVNKIHWSDVYYRRDIGHRAVTRESS